MAVPEIPFVYYSSSTSIKGPSRHLSFYLYWIHIQNNRNHWLSLCEHNQTSPQRYRYLLRQVAIIFIMRQ